MGLLLGSAERAEAQGGTEIPASVVTLEPGFGTPAPLLAEPPVLTDEQRALREEALQRTHLPGPAVRQSGDPSSVAPSGPASEPSSMLGGPRGMLPLAPNDFTVFRNVDLGAAAPSTQTSMVNEPSVAQNGNVVFYTGNWYSALSTDGGLNFSYVNPYTGPFSPAPNGGFCCDQVTTHDPSRNTIYYLQQYVNDVNGGTQRINVDQNADGAFDCYYDFTPQFYGRPAGEWLDFPDLVLGTNYIYHVSNIFDPSDVFTKALLARYQLDEMSSCGVINISYYLLDEFALRPTHDAGTTMYFGSHNSTTSLRIHSWPEGGGLSQVDRTNTTYAASGGVCPGPDARDWCGRADHRIQGAYVAKGVIGFMWNSAQHGGFAYPYIRMARFNESDLSLIDEPVIWNSALAHQYPSVAVNARGDLGGTYLWGGGAFYPNCNAWISDDVFPGFFDNAAVAGSASGPVENKSGDYLSARPQTPDSPNTWVGTCFVLESGGANSNARPRYVWFGRERDLGVECVFDSDCSDGILCNGAEVCSVGVCGSGPPETCDDGSACTGDSCNVGTDLCENVPDATTCDDGVFCNGLEVCDVALGCQAGPAICSTSCCEVSNSCEVDTDLDTIYDPVDNCSALANMDQRDSNADGFGNLCDQDINNDDAVGIPDFNTFLVGFNKAPGSPGYDPDLDFDGDGLGGDGPIGIPDFNLLIAAFNSSPGPSGPNCPHNQCEEGASLTRGCNSCVAQICGADAYCCNNAWDASCVSEVSSICGETCGCDHDICTTGALLDPACDSCVGAICEVDSYCCNNDWDASCVSEVSSVCGRVCP